MSNEEFLVVLKDAFYRYLETDPRSNEKLKVLHGAIAQDLSKRLGKDYTIKSLGYKDSKEEKINGKYMDKNVDITIKHKNKPILAIAVKYIMSNYKQNSNNYFENMLGETINIRSANVPYYHIFVLPAKVPYFEKGRTIKVYEPIEDHYLQKYIELSNDSSNKMHIPDKTLFYLIDIPLPEDAKNSKDYIEYFRIKPNTKITLNNKNIQFGPGFIYNNYNKFIEEICDAVKEKVLEN